MWKFLRTLGFGKLQFELPSHLNVNVLTAQFSILSYKIDAHLKSKTLHKLTLTIIKSNIYFKFEPVPEDLVKKIILAIISNLLAAMDWKE